MRMTLLAATGLFALLAACDSQAPVSNQIDQVAINDTAASDSAAAASSIASLSPPQSREAALKLMHDRHENMESIGDSMKVVGRQLKAGSPDLAAIRSSADTIARLAPQVPGWFPPGTGPDVGKTEAKAEIWERPDDFIAKARNFNQAAQAFQAAARSGDLAAIRERVGQLGKSCKACHDPYREEH